jgi:hypothetical protein
MKLRLIQISFAIAFAVHGGAGPLRPQKPGWRVNLLALVLFICNILTQLYRYIYGIGATIVWCGGRCSTPSQSGSIEKSTR